MSSKRRAINLVSLLFLLSSISKLLLIIIIVIIIIISTVLSVTFEVGVSLLLAPAGADKKGPKAPFPLVENAGTQPEIHKRVPA